MPLTSILSATAADGIPSFWRLALNLVAAFMALLVLKPLRARMGRAAGVMIAPERQEDAHALDEVFAPWQRVGLLEGDRYAYGAAMRSRAANPPAKYWRSAR